MGFQGEVILYTTAESPDRAGVVLRLIDAMQVEDVRIRGGVAWAPGCVITSAMRWDEPNREWEDWLLLSQGIEPDEPAFEHFEGPIDDARLRELLSCGERHYIALSGSLPARPIMRAVCRMPHELTDGANIGNDPSITVGWHDILDGYHTEPFLIDRAWLSVKLSGHWAPNDWDGMRRRILALPELAVFRSLLEPITGPLQSWVRWQ